MSLVEMRGVNAKLRMVCLSKNPHLEMKVMRTLIYLQKTCEVIIVYSLKLAVYGRGLRVGEERRGR
jgi:hypothetical protein